MADHHAQVQQEELQCHKNEQERYRAEGTKWISFKTAVLTLEMCFSNIF
jgi:hypothetical protein